MGKKLTGFILAGLLAAPGLAGASDASEMAAAREAVAQIEQAAQQVGNLATAAKAANDAVKFSCLNDKATQIRSIAQEASGSLSQAMGLTGSALTAKVQGIRGEGAAAQRLRNEAASCVGASDGDDFELAVEEDQADDAEAAEGNPVDPGTSMGTTFADGSAPTSGNRPSGGADSLPAVQVPPAASPTK